MNIDEIRKNYQAKINAHKEKLNLSHVGFARHMGRSLTWVWQIAKNTDSNPTLDTLCYIAEKLDITMQELLFNKD